MRANDAEIFERHRAALVGLAYRMLGDMSRTEDLVQEAWLRWQGRAQEVDAPWSYLVRIITNLCLDDLASARTRLEESRGDRLPEPIALGSADVSEQVSMAFLVMLQRLTPAERAVLLLREVFELDYPEVAAIVGKSEAACRQLLQRARASLQAKRRMFATSREEHRQLLRAFAEASRAGDVQALRRILATDAVLVADAGSSGGRFGRVREVGRPISGAEKVAAFCAAVTPQGAQGLEVRECELNGQPALLLAHEGVPLTAILLGVIDAAIHFVFIQADPERLRRVPLALTTV